MTDPNGYIPPGAIVVGNVEYWAGLGDYDNTVHAIKSGGDVNATSECNHTALHAAATNGHSEIVQLLLDSGADKTIRLTSGQTAADLARECGLDDIADML